MTIASGPKPLIGLADTWLQVLGTRFLDRLGAGIRSAPRDALIAASADEVHRKRAFALEGIGDNLGAFLRSLLTVSLLFAFHLGLRPIFLLAFIPAVLSILAVLLVSEPRGVTVSQRQRRLDLRSLPSG